ncbi:MAG: phenylalanine--tRNA ligase subunit alpha [Hyphomicrobiales bacterium]|nr:MAG: phenylalanine--tRNA ligase subunit alpha [Hyphomicrobiales bacterium]
MSEIETLEAELIGAIDGAADEAALEQLRIAALGKKGSISALMKSLGGMSPDERKVMGPALNGLKTRITEAIGARKSHLAEIALDARLASEFVDVTLPTRDGPLREGRIHPISQVTEEIEAIFADMGFSVAEGPDIEDEHHNFDALNIPESHPARQMMDTFYMPERADGKRMVLRTHTSPVQIRKMENTEPPIRIIAPGRVYRCDYDQTHTPMFHQVEGLVIDKQTHMGQLKWTLEEFCKAFFEVSEVKMRFRPSHFPFTEPSAEVDIGHARVGNQIKIGEGDEWLEILGCGMVHPQVLRNVGYDPEIYQGYAFGMGIDRLAMLKYGMPDLRAFFNSDLRWLKHYGFSVLDVPSLVGGLSS